MGLIDDVERRVGVAVRRFWLEHGPDATPLDDGAATKAVARSDTVLVLCHGNVCRSPMAERYLRGRLRERGHHDVDVDSAGFHGTEGRPSPPEAARAAREFGVALDDHRSKRVTPALLEWADVAFLMDVRNLHRLAGIGGDPPPAFFLGALDSSTAGYEIRDPYDGDAAAFDRAYRQVAGAADDLIDAVVAHRKRSGARDH